MKYTNLKKGLMTFGIFGLLASTSIGSIALMASNTKITKSNTNFKATKDSGAEVDKVAVIKNKIEKQVSDKMNNRFGIWNETNTPEIKKIYEKGISELQAEIASYNTVDAKIIAESVITVWQTQIMGIDSQSYLLGDNGGGILDSYYNTVVGNSEDMKWVVETNDKNWTDAKKVKFATDLAAYFDNLTTNLTEGLKQGINFSQVWLKLYIQNILGTYRYGGLFNEEFKKITETQSFDSSYVTDKTTGVRDTAKWGEGYFASLKIPAGTDTNKTLKTELDKVQKSFDKFFSYLIGDYWKATNKKYGASDLNTDSYKVTKTQDVPAKTEVENKHETLFGIGLTQKDLETKDIGIGFSTNKDDKGVDIYNYMLMRRTSKKDTAQTLNLLGYKKVEAIKKNMEQVAKVVAEIESGTTNDAWLPQFEYDSDGPGPKQPIKQNTSAAENKLEVRKQGGSINLPNFFKFLNGEEWFFGRDKRDNQQLVITDKTNVPVKDGYNSITTTKALAPTDLTNQTQLELKDVSIEKIIGGPTVTGAQLEMGDAGDLYNYWVKGIETAGSSNFSSKFDYKSNDLSNSFGTSMSETDQKERKKEAYIGATHSIDSYLKYKTETNDEFKALFYPVNFDYAITSATGGVGYASYVSAKETTTSTQTYKQPVFYLDVNPYYGLQKWSMSTLSSHEAVSGHTFQFSYALTHPASDKAPKLSFTSYSEGWGLFSEFLATRLNIYGEAQPILKSSSEPGSETERLQLPNFGVNSTSIDINKASTDTYKFGNGAYDDLNGDASQKYYDAMQYFGFLNERQMRAMRLVLDTQTHAGDGNGEPGKGFSIKDQRDFMQENSGLGTGDLNRESLRYLGFVGQATAYMVGLDTIENLYIDASTKYEKNNNDKFINFDQNGKIESAHTHELFDLILRNGGVALEPLAKYGKEFIENNYASTLGLSAGEIAGIAVGSISAVGLLGGAGYWFVKKR